MVTRRFFGKLLAGVSAALVTGATFVKEKCIPRWVSRGYFKDETHHMQDVSPIARQRGGWDMANIDRAAKNFEAAMRKQNG